MDLRAQLQTTLGAAYTLEGELGGSGMSRVFVANDTRLERRVVVKVLSPELAQGISAQRFEREIRLMASLQQANIVPLLNAGETGGLPFYTMPFVEGESLRNRLAKTGALPVSHAVSILRDVARALGYAHARGIVHRDIKPDNVLLSGGAAVVADFGIAKALYAARERAVGSTLTQLGTSIGTPAYISPEQAAGDPNVDHRADIYSFGCMAYELLTGQPPFANRSPQRMMAAHMGENPQAITELRPDTPPALAALVMRTLEKDADARPQSAAEMLPALEATTSSDSGHRAMPPILLGGRRMLQTALAVYAVAFIVVAIIAKTAIVGIGLPDWVFPGTLVVMALGLPVILLTAYTQYVARRAMTASTTYTPGGRPSVAALGTIATLAIRASPHLSWRRTTLGGISAIGAFVVVIGGFMLMRAYGIGPVGSLLGSGALAANDKILIGDFQARTSDTTLGPVVTEAFRTSLGQSQSIVLMQPPAVREAIRRMQRPATSRIDLALAREIAAREGLKAVIDGEIIGVGGSYVISAKLIAAQTGEPLASFTQRADDAKGILPAIDRLTKHMRSKIGESLRKVQSGRLLAQVTTPSLEALKKYVQGYDMLNTGGDFSRATALLEEAIALDTGFAMAYRKLAVELWNRGGQRDRVMKLIQKAYDHRDRLGDIERYLTVAAYYEYGPKPDLSKTVSAYEAVIELAPDQVTALNNVAVAYRTMRDFPKAEIYYKRATAAPVATHFANVIVTQLELEKLDDARETLRLLIAATPTHRLVVSMQAKLALVTGQYDSAAALLERNIATRGSDASARGIWAGERASIAEIQGRIAEARRWRAEQREAEAQLRRATARLTATLDSAYYDAWFLGDRARAARRLDAALQAHPLDSLPAADRPYDRLSSVYALADRPDRARAMAAAFDRTRQDFVLRSDSVTRHHMAAEIAFAEHRYDDAIREFRIADVGVCTHCQLPGLASAYDRGGYVDSAIAVFSRYLDKQNARGGGTDAQYRAGTYKRLGELYEGKGDRQKAATHYAKFVALWKTADPELQPKVAEVKLRLALLSEPELRR